MGERAGGKVNDLATNLFNTANAMNRAKSAELAQTPKGRWDTPSDISPAVVKIPLRAEVRDMMIAAKLYDEQADAARNQAEALLKRADYLEQLARDGRQVAENLTRMANL